MQPARQIAHQAFPKIPAAASGQRIGLMGGTFNPPHQGHLHVAQTALRRLCLDRIWWIVTPRNPLKSRSGLPSTLERVKACRELVRDPRICITGFEASLESKYTVDTISFLKLRHPGVRFVWVMGADSLASFDHWKFWHSIFQMVPIAVIDRPGWRYNGLSSMAAQFFAEFRLPEERSAGLPLAQPPAWAYLTAPLKAESSTALRSESSLSKAR